MIITHEPCDRCRVMRSSAAFATLLVTVSIASAERRRMAPPRDVQQEVHTTAAMAKPRPSVTLRHGVFAMHIAVEASVSSGNVLAPASVAPDVSVGVTDDFTLSVVHSGSALNGFRGSAGWGICV